MQYIYLYNPHITYKTLITYLYRQNKHPQRDHHTSRRIPSSTRQTTHIHVKTSKSTRCKGHYNPSITNLVRTSSIFKLRILQGTSGKQDIRYIVCYHIYSSIFFITTFTNYVQHCKPQGIPFGTQNLKKM
jgi:hypothetical protein